MGGLGRVLLLGGAATAVVTAAVALGTGRRADRAHDALRWIDGLTAAAAALLVGALLVLAAAFAVEDYAFVYVADNARRGVSSAYRVAGVWGGMAGSLLLWTALLATVMSVTVHRLRVAGATERIVARTAAGGALLVAAFAAIDAFAANPFTLLQIPATDGGGLVPILEHPAMLYHPPILYLGLVTLAAPALLTLATLTTGGRDRLDDTWSATVRGWSLVAWLLITFGLLAGANWAYVELGWGGYWAWDPIENGALLPWLATTAALHQLVRGERGRAAAATLTVTAFVLSMIGTLVTRSGAAQSVHAFGEDPAVGLSLLALVTVTTAAAALILLRSLTRHAGSGHPKRAEPERSGDQIQLWLRANGVVLVTLVGVVLVGTLAPIVRDALGGETVTIEGTFYARLAAPLVWIGLALLVATPRVVGIGWPPAVSVLGGLATLALTTAMGVVGLVPMLTIGLGSAAAIASIGAATQARGARRGAFVAHAGLALLLVGVGGTTATTEVVKLLGPGDTVAVADVTVRAEGVVGEEPDRPGQGQPRIIAPVVIERGGATHRLEPMIVGYPAQGVRLAETALWATPAGDVQVALRTADDAGVGLYEIRVKPLASFIWIGALVMLAGGGVALVTSRRGSATSGPASG